MTELEVADAVVRNGSFTLGPVRFTASRGTATVVVGPSGAGKTTLLRSIAGFLPLARGSVRVDGESVDRLPPEKRRLGFIPPDLGLFPHLTVGRNVRYPLDLRGAADARRSAAGWLERFGLTAFAERYPRQLSSGERQRVAIARALAAEPHLLLWDEPLGALDVASRDELLALVTDLLEHEGPPLVLVTHDPPTAFAVARRLVVLEAGSSRFEGEAAELERAPLDRFTARFVGYENVYARVELERERDRPFVSRLLGAAGAEGVAVSASAVHVVPHADERSGARLASLRWTSAGWVAEARVGTLLVRAAPTPERPAGRPGDGVRLEVDLERVRPLELPSGGGRP